MLIDQQLKNNDCGISAVKTIFNRYDLPIDRKYIQENIFLDHNGSRITDLQTFFIKHKFVATFKLLDIDYLIGNIDVLKDHVPFILPVNQKDNKGLHYVIVNSVKGRRLEILDPSKTSHYYLSLHELKAISHFSNSYWDMVQLQEKLCVICNNELATYKIELDQALEGNDHAVLFNKLTYFSYLKDKFGFKDHKTEKQFLTDLLFNQDISSLPKHFRSIKYDREKAKIKAPLILSVKPPENIDKSKFDTKESENIYLTLFRKLDGKRELWYKYIFAALFSALTTYAAIFTNQILIDNVLPSYDINALLLFIIGIGIFKVFDLFTTLYKSFIGIHVSNLFDKFFLAAFDDKINRSSLSYIQSFRKGDLTERLSDALMLKGFFVKTCTRLLIDGMIGVYSLLALFYFNWKLSLVTCVVISLFFVWYKIITPYLKQNERKRFLLKADFVSKTLEKLDAIQVIKSFKIEQFSSSKIHNGIKEILRIQTSSKYIDLLNITVVFFITTIASLFIIYNLSKGVIAENVVTLGQMVTFVALSSRIFSSLRNLLDENLGLQENSVILKRYLDFEGQGNQVHNETGIHDFTVESICISNLSFGYFPNDPILKGIYLRISKGDKIKIEGQNGSGKSTLSKILALLYEPTSGGMMINDTDSKFYNNNSIRDKILLVTNEDTLFNETIEFNICLNRDVPTLKILELAKKINFYDFMASKEDGLNFLISENGRNLSTGQRKKILLMRAFFSSAEVIILDEVLSGMDALSRANVETIIDESHDKTFIIISHEAVTNINFTEKYLIKNGELTLSDYVSQ